MASSTYLLKFGADYKSVTKALGDINSQMRALRSENRNLSNTFKISGDSSIAVQQIKNLEKQYDLLHEKQQLYQETLDEVSKSDSFDKNSKSAQRLQSDLAKVTSQMALVSAQSDKLKESSAFSQFDTQIKNAETQLNALQDAGRKFNSSFKLTGDIGSFDSMLSNMAEQVRSAGTLVDALHSKLDTMKEDDSFDAQSSEAQNLQASIIKAEATLSQLKASYSSLSEEKPFVGVQSELSTLDDKIKSSEEDAKNFSSAFKATGDLDTLKSQLSSMQEALSASESKVTILKSALSSLESDPAISNESNKVRTLKSDLISAETEVTQLRSHINELAGENGLRESSNQASSFKRILLDALGAGPVITFREQLQSIKASLGGVSESADQTGNHLKRSLSDGASSVEQTSGKFRLLSGAVTSTINPLETVRLKLSNIIGISAGLGMITSAFNALKSNLDGAVGRFDTLNRFPVVMKQLGYSTSDTAQATKTLSDGIDGLPTQLQDITQSAQELAPMTGSVQSAADAALALNDAFLASGASVEDAQRGQIQYNQMLADGKVDMQSWTTLMQTMPASLRQVANAFGFTGASAEKDLYSALQSGQITIQQLNDKFVQLDKAQGGFAQQARNNSAGIGTSFANLKASVVKNMGNMLTAINKGFGDAGLGSIAQQLDKMKLGVNKAFDDINPHAEQATKQILQFVQQSGAVGKVKGFFDSVGKSIEGVWNWLKQPLPGGKSPLQMGLNFIIQSAQNLSNIANAVIGALKDLFQWTTKPIQGKKSPLELALEGLMSISKDIGKVIGAVADGIKRVMDQLTRPTAKGGKSPLSQALNDLRPITSRIVPLFGALAGAISAIFSLLTKPIGGKGGKSPLALAFEALMLAIQPIINIIGNIMQALTGLLQFITGVFTGNWSKAWSGIVNFVKGAVKAIAGILSYVFFGGLARNAIGALRAGFGTLPRLFSSWFGDAVNWASRHLGRLGGIAKSAWGGITQVFGIVGSWFSRIFSSGVTAIRNALNPQTLGRIGTEAWNGLKSAFNNVWNWMKDIGANIVKGLWAGITGLGSWFAGKVADFVKNTVPQPIRKALGIHSPSRVMADEVGRFIPSGIAQGINENAEILTDTMTGLKDGIMAGVSDLNPADAIMKNTEISGVEQLQNSRLGINQFGATAALNTIRVNSLTHAVLSLRNSLMALNAISRITRINLSGVGNSLNRIQVNIQGVQQSTDRLRQTVADETRRVLRQESLI